MGTPWAIVDLLAYLEHTAEEHAITVQRRQPGGGGTDAGAIHRSRGGIPSLSISVPGRYLHGPYAYPAWPTGVVRSI